jgi:hypothetical protein
VDEELYNSIIIDGLLCAHYQEIIPLDYWWSDVHIIHPAIDRMVCSETRLRQQQESRDH